MRAFVVTKYKGPLQRSRRPGADRGGAGRARPGPGGGPQPARREDPRWASSSRSCRTSCRSILGNDVAGTVIRVGAKVRGFKPGDEVYARPRDKDRIGTFAERIAVAEADLALKPASISMEEAGSLPLVALDRVAGPRRARQRAARAEGPHPRRGRRGRVDRDPARQAPRRARSPPPPAPPTPTSCATLGADIVIDYRTPGLRTAPRPATTSCSTASAGRTSRSRCASSSPAARRSGSPARRTRPSPATPA